MIEWDSKYELGIGSIDGQHKKLVDLINELAELLEDAINGSDIYDKVIELMKGLKDYTVYHFKYEEDLFDKYAYPFKEIHKNEHAKLIKELEEFDIYSLDEDQVGNGNKLLKFLISWLFKHISGSDFLYRDLMIENAID